MMSGDVPPIDIMIPDVFVVPDIPGIDPCGARPCGKFELCGPGVDGGLGAGNGIDDNCDNRVDELCPCRPGEARECFPGASDRRGVGVCRSGSMRCTELGAWVGNECVGATVPTEEACNGRDDDCDGSIDESLPLCMGALQCPSSAGIAPLQTYTVDGRTIDATARNFRWDVTCPEGISPCPMPVSVDAPTLQFMAVRAGTYRIVLTLTRADGRTETCRFPLYVQGRGLRVELDWDQKGGIASAGVDLDLHIAPMDRTTVRTYQWFTRDDCYFATCKAPGTIVNWSTSPTDMRFAPSVGTALCENAPPPFGEVWRSSGRCTNPRLDTDNIECDPRVRDPRDAEFCFPENAAIDNPPDDVTFRLMVNFYRDHGTCTDMDVRNDVVHPVLSIHCGGALRAFVGSVDDGIVGMRCRDNPEIGSLNWAWLAADVRFFTNECGLRDCRVTPLRGRETMTRCDAPGDGDVCVDSQRRVFVRRTASRAVEAELAESP
jgi:hypothetical protein